MNDCIWNIIEYTIVLSLFVTLNIYLYALKKRIWVQRCSVPILPNNFEYLPYSVNVNFQFIDDKIQNKLITSS